MDEKLLQKWLAQLPPDPTPVSTPNAWGRAAKNLGNLPTNIVEGLFNTAGSLMNPIGASEGARLDIPDFFPVDSAPSSIGETAADILLGQHGFADIIGQSLTGVGAAGYAGKALGMSSGPALESLKWGVGFAGPETQRPGADTTDVAVAGGIGAASGPLMLLPRKQRLLPTSLMAFLHGAYETDKHGANMGLIAGGADIIGTLLPPAMGSAARGLKSPIEFNLVDSPAHVAPFVPQEIPRGNIRSEWQGPVRPGRKVSYMEGPMTSELAYGEQLAEHDVFATLQNRTNPNSQFPVEPWQGPIASSIDNPRSAFQANTYKNLLQKLQYRYYGDPKSKSHLYRKILSQRDRVEAPVLEGALDNPQSLAQAARLRDSLIALDQPQSYIDPRSGFAQLDTPNRMLPPSMHDLPRIQPIEGPIASSLDNPQSALQAAVYRDSLLGLERDVATLQPKSSFASKLTPDRVRKPYIRQPKVAAVIPETAVTPPAVVSLDAERTAYLRNLYGKMDDNDLRGALAIIDDSIANTLDPASIAEDRATRALVEQMLGERKAPTPIAAPRANSTPSVVSAPTETKLPFQPQQRVMTRTRKGVENHGTFEGMDEFGQARVRFDGDTEVVSLNASKLLKAESEVPEIATLQKVKGEVFDDNEVDVVAKWLANEKIPDVEPTPVQGKGKIFSAKDEESVSKALAGEETGGLADDIPEGMEGQDFEWSMMGPRPQTGESFAIHLSGLPPAARVAVDKIADAIRATVNKNLKIAFKQGHEFKKGQLAGSSPTGDISVNIDKVIEHLDGWHNFNPAQRGEALANISRWIGHEAGHTILSFMQAKNPRLLSKLIVEFETLGTEGRYALIEDFHKMLGHKDPHAVLYTSGHPIMMSDVDLGYGFHERNTAAMNYTGVHEFFAEMSAAHIFGKLKADLLPPELKSLWTKFKDMMKAIVDRLFRSDRSSFDDIDSELAFRNFKEIMGNLHDRFNRLSEAEFRELSSKSGEFTKNKIQRLLAEDNKVKRQIALEDYEIAVQNIVKEEREMAQAISHSGGPSISEANSSYLDSILHAGEDEFSYGTRQFATLQNSPAGGMRRKIVGNAGFIEAQMLQHLGMGVGGALTGGIAGPKLTDGQLSVAEGMFMGGVLGFAGPVLFKRMLMTMPKAGTTAFQHMSGKEALRSLFTSEGRHLLGGDAANGQGSAPAKLIRFLERNLNLHLPANLYNAVIQAEGPASYAVQLASDAFAKARTYTTTPVIDKAVVDYLSGTSTVSQLRALLGSSAEAQQFGNFIVTGRESIGVLQEMLQSGLREGAFKNQVIASLQKGDYLTRQYRMFHDPDYKPTQSQIEALSLELSHAHPEYDLSTARIHVEDYLHQIEIERGMFSGGKNDVGQKLDMTLFSRKNDSLGVAFRDALGEYTNPKEQIMGTIRHLYTNAISSKFYDQVSNMSDSMGLKMSYSYEEHAAAVQAIDAQLAHPPATATRETIATLQRQRRELEHFVPTDKNVRYGKLGGKMVNRFVRDQLASYDSPWGLMDGSIMRSLSNFHNYIKIGRTALNPITVVRNMISAPILMSLARANPLDAPLAMRAIKDLSSGLGKEMLEQGIYGVDQVRGEFFRNAEQILMGDYDHRGLEGIFKTGMNKVLEFYRMPDMLARGTTYLTAKRRFAGELKLPENHKSVIDAARDWTNRYTVNYANVAPLVKSLRQIPFTNLFISYTAEITRIAKNLVEDIFTHPSSAQRIWATGAVGGLVSLPFLLEKGSLQNLSPKDQEEWKKSQAQMPDYSRSRFRMVLGKESGKFRYLDITPLLQIDPLLQMMRNGANGDWRAFLATNPVLGWENTPILNIAAEQIAGKDLRTGRPIDTPVKRVQEVMKEIVPPLAPGGYEFQRATEAFSKTETGERGVTNLRTGRRTTPGELVVSYMSGARLATVDTNFLHRNVVSEAKRRLANEASYLRDIQQTTLPKAAKDKAAERYRRAAAEILEDMNEKLSGKVP